MGQTGDNMATQFLIQKIAIDVQRGNAAFAGLGRVYFSAIGKLTSTLNCAFYTKKLNSRDATVLIDSL